MSKKKILIISPKGIFPPVMGNQGRIINLTKELHKDHLVDLVTFENNRNYADYGESYRQICRRHYPILIPNNKNNVLVRDFYLGVRVIMQLFFGIPPEYFSFSLPAIQSKLYQIIKEGYDIVQFEYWFVGRFIKRMKTKPFLAIDTHDIYHQFIESEIKNMRLVQRMLKIGGARTLKVAKKMEFDYLNLCNLIIAVSQPDYRYFKNNFLNKDILCIPSGLNLERFSNILPIAKERKPTVLFYGNLSSFQNVHSFFELWNKIFPKIKHALPDVQLKVAGSDPCDDIKKLQKTGYVKVTGYLDDPVEAISSCHLMILPTKIVAGFRSRLVEVMACSLPIIGTRIAVESLELRDGVHGYISDDYDVLVQRSIELLQDAGQRERMGTECKKLVLSKYTIEETYRKLSEYYLDLDLSNI